jgi:signal transduction protein with GAF and PtsI domain
VRCSITGDVLDTILACAVELAGAEGGAIYEIDETTQVLELRATQGMSEEMIDAIREAQTRPGETLAGQAVVRREAIQIADIQDEPD